MYMVLLRFSANRDKAGTFMDGHKDWIRRGFDDGVFLMAGSLDGGAGGAVLAHGVEEADLRARVDADPFVAEDVVDAEIIAVAPSRLDPRLEFLGS